MQKLGARMLNRCTVTQETETRIEGTIELQTFKGRKRREQSGACCDTNGDFVMAGLDFEFETEQSLVCPRPGNCVS